MMEAHLTKEKQMKIKRCPNAVEVSETFSFSFEDIKEREGVYAFCNNESYVRIIVVSSRWNTVILYYDKVLNELEACNYDNFQGERFIRTDETVKMEVS